MCYKMYCTSVIDNFELYILLIGMIIWSVFRPKTEILKKNTTSDYMTKISHSAQAETSAWFELSELKILNQAEILSCNRFSLEN